MTSSLVLLEGALLLDCQVDERSLVLRFDAMRRLVVHNSWLLRDSEKKEVALTAIVGTTVTDRRTSAFALRVKFGQFVLDVDLSATAWNGPEAAVLYEDSRPVAVWT
ncbi:MAG: hypothetical protein V4684_07410 [Pseudomonadota bacterium]